MKIKEIEKILSKANMPKLKNILTPELIMEKNVIYRYYCRGNGLSYIGKCGDRPVIYRWREHIGKLRNNRHGITPTNPNTDYFQNAWNKYGEDSFTLEVIDVTTGELLNEKERDWISRYNSYHNGFNRTEGGDGLTSEAGKKTWSNPEIYAKRVEAAKKAWSDPEVRARTVAAMKVSAKKTWSNPDVKQRHSESVKKTWSDPKVKAKRVASIKIARNRPDVRAKKQKITDKQYVIIAEEYLQGKFNSFAECARFYNVDSATIRDMFSYKYCRKICRNEIIRLCEQYNYPMRGLEVA